eukprot:297464_1
MRISSESYRCFDFLSIFYGISNSIISILDSISDILFIVFLWGFSDIQNVEGSNYNFEQTQKITNFLMVLSIGNLIAVAIAIALYTTQQAEIENVWKKNALRVIFFMLSPFLPAFEWVLQKVESYNPNALEVYTGCHGLLLWFQQELVRNKIFMIESLFESCFQIIIQFITVFALQSAEYKDVYLYSSMFISFIVIISKFVLVSYNRNYSMICFNLVCFSMDILSSLIFGLFI